MVLTLDAPQIYGYGYIPEKPYAFVPNSFDFLKELLYDLVPFSSEISIYQFRIEDVFRGLLPPVDLWVHKN